MGRKLGDVIRSLPLDRQKKIESLAQAKAQEMIANGKALADFRKALGKTQMEVAKALGVKQNAVSQLEKRSDIYLSTLRRYLESLGMALELSVIAENGVRIDLRNFLQPEIASEDETTSSSIAKRSPRKPSAKAAQEKTPTVSARRGRRPAAKWPDAKKESDISLHGDIVRGAIKKPKAAVPKHSNVLRKA